MKVMKVMKRELAGIDGSLALKLDFGEAPAAVTVTVGRGRAGLRLAPGSGRLTGPDKYRLLEHRRRQAQIRARRLLFDAGGLDIRPPGPGRAASRF